MNQVSFVIAAEVLPVPWRRVRRQSYQPQTALGLGGHSGPASWALALDAPIM